jgi:precorrin-4/cobalt-precorrin-4 C11-methyltransferase
VNAPDAAEAPAGAAARAPARMGEARSAGGGAQRTGLVSFVGAGPGAPDLLTLRAADRLARADVVVWASSLVPEAVLDHARPDAEIHDSAGMTFEDVVGVYAAHPGARIVRLHSGDLSLYSAVQEQLDWCAAQGREVEIVPGVGALAAASAAAARELTGPGVAQAVIATRLPGRTAASVPPNEDLTALAAHGTTLAVYLSGARPEELQAALLAGGAYDDATPAVVVVRASWPDEQVVPTTVGGLPAAMRATGARTVMLVLVGPALAGAAQRCHLYDPTYAHGYRRRSLPGTTAGRPRAAGGTA